MSLKDKTILVTGGSRGIGRATVLLLAGQGADVLFTYHTSDESAREVERLAHKEGGRAEGYKVDLCDIRQIENFMKQALSGHEPVSALVNNAGIRLDRTLLYMNWEEWRKVMDTNLDGVYRMTKAVLPYLLKARRGRIVNISSVSGISGLSGQTNYSAAKAGLIGFTKALAKEVASYGVTVNAIAPGPVETQMLTGLSEEYLERLLHGVPARRLCTPDEVAMLVRVLLDEELTPGYLTGQTIALDGGMGL